MLLKASALGSILLSGLITSSLVFDPVNHHQISPLVLAEEKIINEHIFLKPTVNGYRLSNCADKHQDCQGLAAELYCLEKGFNFLEGYTLSQSLGFDTKAIGSGSICRSTSQQCQSYEEISCASANHFAKRHNNTQATTRSTDIRSFL